MVPRQLLGLAKLRPTFLLHGPGRGGAVSGAVVGLAALPRPKPGLPFLNRSLELLLGRRLFWISIQVA